jgi:hypothetical protein
MVAAALQDHHGVTIVGTQTLGHDSITSVYRLQDGTALLYLTTARWLTPKKTSVRAGGVKPDVIVESQNTARCEMPTADNDSQLQEALAVFKTRPPAVSEVARLLLDRNATVQVPSRGRVKSSIKKGAQTFGMPEGESTVVLLRFPDYQTPYTMTISSLRMGSTEEIFLPSGVFFDEEFHWLSSFSSESGLRADARNVAKVLRMDDAFRKARYLMLYTRGDFVGKPVGGYGIGVASLRRSLVADIEVNTTPDDRRK